ncbi:MAG: hypothetical protein H3C34_16885 [Caldilineaceae bacterium]|nr:hypothetical protein [Caldilineaceae bacterium]
MSLPEIEFELPAHQYELMGYPGLRQGEALSVTLDGGVLLPDPAAEGWFTVQKEALEPRFVHVGPALYGFAGQIVEAELSKEYHEESGMLLVNCGDVLVRVTCAPGEDGRLPYGTWETRYLTGMARFQGIVEEEFTTSIGRPLGVTIWRFRRLVLTPGDTLFGQWHETVELPMQPYRYDRIYITAHVHRWQGTERL